MGQQGSRSARETRAIFHRMGQVDMNPGTDARSTPASVVHIQEMVTSESACLHPCARAQAKSTHNSWPQSRGDSGGLVYVVDNPTGGVWVKPEENWARS